MNASQHLVSGNLHAGEQVDRSEAFRRLGLQLRKRTPELVYPRAGVVISDCDTVDLGSHVVE